MLRHLRLRLRGLVAPGRTDAELVEEMAFHVEREAQMYERQGYTHEEALRKARLAFGSIENTAELHRDGRGSRGLHDTLKDIRYAARAIRRDRALALAGVLTLALGIGATTAVFSAVNAVMLRELPFRQSERLVSLWEENPDRGWYKNVVAPANYLDWRERADGFVDIAAYTDYPTNVTLLGHGEPTLLNAAYVTGNFLPVLGVSLPMGNGFSPGDDWDNGQRPAIISDRIWRTHFRADPGVIGRTMSFGGRSAWQIVGVMPKAFSFPSPTTDVWLPMLWNPASRSQVSFRRAHWLRTVARLKPGVSTESANASLQRVVKQLQDEYPATNTRMGGGVTPLREWIVGDTKRPLLVLLSAAAILLLIACANVGNLLLVHALGRSRDVALRFALGASRRRVAKQAMTESLVLSAVGAALGAALGWIGARALLAIQPAGMLPVTDIPLDLRVLAFTVLVATISGLAFGVAPALMATRTSPSAALSSGGRTLAGSRVQGWGRHLVVAEIALAVLLTVAAGLLVRSYDRLSNVPPGFNPEGVLTFSLSIPAARYDSAGKVIGFYEALLARIEATPGVQGAAAIRQLPATFTSWSSSLAIAGRPPMPQGEDVLHREFLGEYFRLMEVPLLRGRAYSSADVQGGPPVVVINEALAKQYFPGEEPIGQRIAFDRVPDSNSVWRTIVGVVGNERQGSLALPARPEIFAPQQQDWNRTMFVVAKARPGIDPTSLAVPVRRAVRDLDSLLAVNAMRPMTAVHAEATARERFISVLVLVFAITGVALALVGVFGVLAQLVQSRWRELGIRLALGAQRSEVRWLVLRRGATLLSIGIASGLVISAGASRVLQSLLYEVQPTDPVTFITVTILMGVIGLAAALIPAWRASSANPAHTLRAE